MCIICVKPKNKAIPSVELLNECFKNNPHGAGIMYPQNGKIRVLKGLMDIESVLNALNQIPNAKNIPIVIHFRFATHGDKSAENTHPFPLSGDYNDLIKLDTEVYRAMVHNGIMYQYGSKSARLSDSAFFAKLLSGLQSDKAIKRAVEAHRNYGKFVIMSADDKNGAKLLRVGDFVKFEGCFWSNGGFKRTIWITNPDLRVIHTPVNQYNSCIGISENDINDSFYEKYPECNAKLSKYPAFERGTQYAREKIREFENAERKERILQLRLINADNSISDIDKELEKDEKFREYLEKQNRLGSIP